MKTIKFLISIVVVVLLTSCATTAKFPVSTTVPGAEISATKKQDKNDNYIVEITARNLADPGRLNPPKKNYSVWLVEENGSTRNAGQLSSRGGKKTNLEISTPFNVKEIFITAEEQGNLNYPAGIEISRARFRK
jgi:hypothetical protein